MGPTTAMVLAAGRGERLRPLTDQLPKPLVQVAGRSLIDRLLDRLESAGVTDVVVNLHYKAEMLTAHLEKRQKRRGPNLTFSNEVDRLLDTGGGVVNALNLLGDEPFWVANSDFIWRDAYVDSLQEMARIWRPEAMDMLLLLQPTVTAHGFHGKGDFNMAPDGKLTRRLDDEVAPFLYAGIQIVHPRIFADCPDGPFSFNLLFDRAAEAETLNGVRHDGDWIGVGTPEGLEVAQSLLGDVA